MCGRYACAITNFGRWGSVFKMWLEEMENFTKYNIAPTTSVPVYTRDGWKKMRWGLVPSWSKEPKTKYATFNARRESFVEKPAYRGAWAANRRCLIPLSGYYEWKKIQEEKQVYYVTSRLDEPLVLAGIWEKWEKDKNRLYSCTIITTASEGALKELHHRMPIILQPEQGNGWLEGSREDALNILDNTDLSQIHYYRVANDVGNPRQQGSALIDPIE